jgi:hypothetical protein
LQYWKETVTTYLHSKIGLASLPLAYIICNADVPIPNIYYAMVHDQLVNSAILHGAECNTNNGMYTLYFSCSP